MDAQEYNYLLAEQAQLERMLERIPGNRPIDRKGLEVRLTRLAERIRKETPVEPVRAKLTFRGRPVVDSRGVFAEFGTVAVKAFTDAVAAVGASLIQTLSAQGPLPSRNDHHRLMITATATGSFGFELQEVPEEVRHLSGMSPVEGALERTMAIFEATVGTDDDLTEALAELDPRAIESIRHFLDHLAKNEAVCAFAFHDEVFRFQDVSEIRRCAGRLSQQNIHEADEELIGRLLGVLPTKRQFEFLEEGSEEPISGKISAAVETPATINSLLGQIVRIRVRTRRVGNGSPRYQLEDFEQLVRGVPSK